MDNKEELYNQLKEVIENFSLRTNNILDDDEIMKILENLAKYYSL